MKDFEGAISRGKLFQPANELVTSAPNCTSLLHLNVFVFLFLLTPVRTTFSPFCRHALCCLLALFFSLMLLLSFQSLRFPLNSHPSTQLYVGPQRPVSEMMDMQSPAIIPFFTSVIIIISFSLLLRPSLLSPPQRHNHVILLLIFLLSRTPLVTPL